MDYKSIYSLCVLLYELLIITLEDALETLPGAEIVDKTDLVEGMQKLALNIDSLIEREIDKQLPYSPRLTDFAP
jgi:hypothetical protein